MRTRVLAPMAAVMLVLSTTALAAQKKGELVAAASSGDIITQMSGNEVQGLLRELGYSPRPLENRDNAWAIELNGQRTIVFLSSSGKNLQLWSYVVGGGKVTLEKVNEWNKTKRFSRAYLDSDGDPNVEYDIDLEGGVSTGAVREGIRTFGIVITAFKDFF